MLSVFIYDQPECGIIPVYALSQKDIKLTEVYIIAVRKVVSLSHIKLVAGETSSGPEVLKKISCSTQLSMKFFLPINVKMPTIVGFLTIVGILTFMSRKNSILGLSEPGKR